MILLDSSAWLEYFAGTENAENFSAPAEDFENLLVPVICLYEVFKKLLLVSNESSAIEATDFMMNGKVVDIDSEISLSASRLSAKHKLPMADCLIYTIALLYNAELYTQDIDFKGLAGVRYFQK